MISCSSPWLRSEIESLVSDYDSNHIPSYSPDSFTSKIQETGDTWPERDHWRKCVSERVSNSLRQVYKVYQRHRVKRTTDHYTHWCDSKSCSSRISSGNLKDNMLGNIEVPNLYTTVTPKSFLPPSPLRAKQFVMPLKLHQLEPQKKPAAPSSDLTVTFVHRKMSDSSANSKHSCHRSGATSKQSKSSANSSKQNNKQTDPVSPAPSQPGYPDPLEHAPVAFVSRLAEMTGHQADTVRFERNKRGKARTRIS